MRRTVTGHRPEPTPIERAAAMGIATFAGTALPAVPWLLTTGAAALVACVLLAVVATFGIGEARHRVEGEGDASRAVFGSADGLICAMSVVIPAVASSLGRKTILVTAFGLAAGGGASMAVGEWLGDKCKVDSRWVAYGQTFGTLIFAAAIGVGAGLAFGAVG